MNHYLFFNSFGTPQFSIWACAVCATFSFYRYWENRKNTESFHWGDTSQSGNWWCLRSCCGFRAALALLHPVLVASSMLEVLQGFCFCSSPAVLLPFWETTSNIKMKQELQILLHAVGLKSSNVAELLCSFVLLKSGYLNFVWCETVFQNSILIFKFLFEGF